MDVPDKKNKGQILIIQNTDHNGKSSEFKLYVTVFVVFWSMVTCLKGWDHIQGYNSINSFRMYFGTSVVRQSCTTLCKGYTYHTPTK